MSIKDKINNLRKKSELKALAALIAISTALPSFAQEQKVVDAQKNNAELVDFGTGDFSTGTYEKVVANTLGLGKKGLTSRLSERRDFAIYTSNNGVATIDENGNGFFAVLKNDTIDFNMYYNKKIIPSDDAKINQSLFSLYTIYGPDNTPFFDAMQQYEQAGIVVGVNRLDNDYTTKYGVPGLEVVREDENSAGDYTTKYGVPPSTVVIQNRNTSDSEYTTKYGVPNLKPSVKKKRTATFGYTTKYGVSEIRSR